MKQLKAKLNKQGGFTLIEMLIVVAIIAILVAISIPVVNTSLEKARDATDEANVRAAKSVTLMYFMGAIDDTAIPDAPTSLDGPYTAGMAIPKNPGAQPVYYDAVKGIITYKQPVGYGQCTGCKNSENGLTHVGMVIQIGISEAGEFEYEWAPGASGDPEEDPGYDPWEGL